MGRINVDDTVFYDGSMFRVISVTPKKIKCLRLIRWIMFDIPPNLTKLHDVFGWVNVVTYHFNACYDDYTWIMKNKIDQFSINIIEYDKPYVVYDGDRPINIQSDAWGWVYDYKSV